MELKQLYYFATIAKYKSFSAAAEKLFISQPALTTSVKHLESELGTKLLSRLPTGVSLTTDGEYVLDIATKMLTLKENMMEHFASDRYEDYEGLKIMTLPFIKEYFLLDHIVNFVNKFPQKKLEIISADNDTIIQNLVDQTIDLGFFSQTYCDQQPLYDFPSHLAYTPFCSGQYAVGISPLCTLNNKKTLSLSTLVHSNYRLLLIKSSSVNSDDAERILTHYHLKPKVLMVDSLNLMRQFVSTTNSFVLSPNFAIDGLQQHVMPLTDSIICQLNYAIAPQKQSNPFIRMFIDNLI